MSEVKKVETSLKKGALSTFLGALLYFPLGSLPLVMFQLYLLPGVFLNALQQNLNVKYKYIPGLIIAAVANFYFDSAFVASLVLVSMALLGLFQIFYKEGFGLFKSGVFSVGPIALMLIFIFQYFSAKANFNISDIDKYALWEFMQLNVSSNVLLEDVIQMSYIKQLGFLFPATTIVFCSLIIFVAIIFERKVVEKFFNKQSLLENLTYFKVPEYFVWLAIISGAVAFIDHQFIYIKYIAQNIVFVCAVLYYFQGFAILFNFFEVFKVGLFSKVLMTFCLAISLVQVTLVMGLLDYWYNFRARFLKRATQVNERRN